MKKKKGGRGLPGLARGGRVTGPFRGEKRPNRMAEGVVPNYYAGEVVRKNAKGVKN